ncbi:MAG: hypothetical protein MRJ67_16985 [Nitrospirales bacterium]|nr:hypothetical protein [Nitrospirales bacterium]
MLAGNGVIRGHSSKALVRFAELLNIPVATTFMAKGVNPDTHPLSLGAIGPETLDYVNREFVEADVVIAIVYDIMKYVPHTLNPNRDKKIVHVDMSPAEVDASYTVNVEVIGNITPSLEALTDRGNAHVPTRTSRFRQMRREELAQGGQDTSFPFKPQRILADLRSSLAHDDIVISDVGAHKVWHGAPLPMLSSQHLHHLERVRRRGHCPSQRSGG